MTQAFESYARQIKETQVELTRLEAGEPLTPEQRGFAQETLDFLEKNGARRPDDTLESVMKEALGAVIRSLDTAIAHADVHKRTSR